MSSPSMTKHDPPAATLQDEALSTGAEFIGEGFIFGVVVAVTAWEYQQSAAKSVVLPAPTLRCRYY